MIKLETAASLRDLKPTVEVRLSLAAVRLLLRALLPEPTFDREAALALVNYHQRRKVASYRSHHKRRLSLLARLLRHVSL